MGWLLELILNLPDLSCRWLPLVLVLNWPLVLSALALWWHVPPSVDCMVLLSLARKMEVVCRPVLKKLIFSPVNRFFKCAFKT